MKRVCHIARTLSHMGGGKAEKHIIPGGRIHVCNRECSSVWQFSAHLDCQNRRFDKQEKILSKAKALALWSQSGTEPIFVAYFTKGWNFGQACYLPTLSNICLFF